MAQQSTTQPILAQYTVRSKQEYIFRSNRMQEIVGASAMISQSFDLLFSCAERLGVKTERGGGAFRMGETLRKFDGGALDMVELFIGGGNDTVLFRDREVCRRVNEAFTYAVLKERPGMIPMYVGVPIAPAEDGAYNYREDYTALMRAAETEKKRMEPGRGRYAVPFARTDRMNFQPQSIRISIGGSEMWLSDEAYAKRVFNRREDARFLDDLVTQRGEESLLAIVHADGNNMGAKIQRKLGDATDYDACVTTMRRFTANIADAFTKAGRDAMERRGAELAAAEREKERPRLKPSAFKARWIVADGDDATFICNAALAKDLTEAYLRGVSAYRAKDDPGEAYSSCAGICIFHSHYPFARAYALAEQACDNAKAPVHKAAAARGGEPGEPSEQAWLDFHYIRGGAGGDLDELRELHQTGRRMARPWFVCGQSTEESGAKSVGKLDKLAEVLAGHKVSRSNIKTLGAVCEEDAAQGALEWKRICYRARQQGEGALEQEAESLFSGNREELMKALYDLSEVYDLWYRKEAVGGADY